MKTTLEFTLPEEQHELDVALEGNKWWSVVHSYDQFLRGKIKYAPDDTPELILAVYDRCRDTLRGMIEDEHLNLDK
jgi:hypothetical protein